MKRLLALVALSLFLAACATTATPNLTGVISKIDGSIVTVTPTSGSGEASEVVLNWGTRVYQPNGLEADGVSVLTVGQSVQVWLEKGSKTATRINIAQ